MALTSLRSVIGPIFGSRPAGDALALLFAGFAALNGVATLFSLLSGKYGDFAREGGLPFYLFHVCGYIAIGYGITAYFAASEGSEAYPIEAAIAYGLLPLLLFQFKALASGYFDRLAGGRRNWIMVLTVSGSAVLCSLMLAGGSSPVEKRVCAQAMSAGLGVRGLSWMALPGKTEKMLYKVVISERDRDAVKAVGTELGQNLVTYATLAGALSYGATPLHSIGFSSLVHTVLLFYNTALSRTFIDAKASPVPGRIYVAISAFFACAFFLALPFKSRNILQSVSVPL